MQREHLDSILSLNSLLFCSYNLKSIQKIDTALIWVHTRPFLSSPSSHHGKCSDFNYLAIHSSVKWITFENVRVSRPCCAFWNVILLDDLCLISKIILVDNLIYLRIYVLSVCSNRKLNLFFDTFSNLMCKFCIISCLKMSIFLHHFVKMATHFYSNYISCLYTLASCFCLTFWLMILFSCMCVHDVHT